MDFKDEILRRLKELGMPQAVLASRCGVSLSTLGRVLQHPDNASLSLLKRIAEVTGLQFDFMLGEYHPGDLPGRRPLELKEAQAKAKAVQIVSEVQGTSALEGQGVSVEAFRDMVQKTIHQLMAGSSRRLWA